MTIVPQCFDCKHLDPGPRKPGEPMICKAFPAGIPAKIERNKHDHKKPYPGDHGIHFEPSDRS